MAANIGHTKGAMPAPELHAPSADGASATMYSRGSVHTRPRQRKRSAQLEQKLQHHVDDEDKRVKELTEAVLYDFLPAALNVMLPHCEDPLQELEADRCRAVAGAALAVSALMNAPPGFLEFLLCVPWKKLSQLYPKSDSIDKLISNLHVTDEERKKLVNTRIDPALMNTLLDFLYREDHADSVPPILQLTKPSPGSEVQPEYHEPVVTLETVAALLDGATPLHCAALRGNPAQVDHLLFCGADPTAQTTAGEMPIEFVPVCGDRSPITGQKVCRCMGSADQEVWECRSKLARTLIARKAVCNIRVGIFTWLKMVFLCLLCCLGQWGCHQHICRPVIQQHVVTRRQQKRQEARSRAQNLMARMRAEAQQGHTHLSQAQKECTRYQKRLEAPTIPQPPLQQHQHQQHQLLGSSSAQHSSVDQALDIATTNGNHLTGAPPAFQIQASQGNLQASKAQPSTSPGLLDISFHLKPDNDSSTTEEPASEKAFKCFVRAVHALQSLDLQGETIPQVFFDSVQPDCESHQTHVLEDEQADLYCCWAESVLLKFRACTCPGCAALAVQAVRMAHIHATRLYTRVEKLRSAHPARWKAVGQALARVVYVHVCLLLETEAQASPTKSSVFRAEQCLKEWDRLVKTGLTEDCGIADLSHVDLLQHWAKTSDSDLYIAEALLGSSLSPGQTLQEVLLATVSYSKASVPYLSRPISQEVAQQIEQAITLACHPSPVLSQLAKSLARNTADEMAAAVRLRDVVNSKGTTAGNSESVNMLAEAIALAEAFPRLANEVNSVRGLQEKWLKRAEAVERLETVVDDVRSYASSHPLALLKRLSDQGQSSDQGRNSNGAANGTGTSTCNSSTLTNDLAEWDQKIKHLETAINEAKDANISVNKAKKLLKELQAHSSAVEAASYLEGVMAKKPAGPGALKAALSKAEAAASALNSSGSPALLNELLLPRIQSGRRRLEVERAAEALYKAALNCKTVADLPKLEAAILNARKVGAEELDADVYKSASDLRAKLNDASRARQALDAAVKSLQKGLKAEEAEQVEKLLADTMKWEDLLGAEIAKGKDALEQWRSQVASEAKLTRVLREGSSTAVLSRAIQEASSSGVKVQAAKRILKLMQGLEQAMMATGEGAAAQYATLKARLEAAEQGGVVSVLVPAARTMLHRLQIEDIRETLEAALKPHSDWSVAQRATVLKAALEKAEEVVGSTGSAYDGQAGDTGSDSKAAGFASDSSMSAPIISEDAADMAVVLELARRAQQLLEEDQRELARLEAERAAADKERKERQERERQERHRLEQERQQREKHELQEREKALAEKRERMQKERQQTRTQKGKVDVTPAHTAAYNQATSKGPAANSGPAVAHFKEQARKGPQKASQAPAGAAQQLKQQADKVASARSSVDLNNGDAGLHASYGSLSAVVTSVFASSSLASSHAPGVASGSSCDGSTSISPSDNHAQDLSTSQLLMGLHARGDSLESLGEASLKLNKDMLEALDLDHESSAAGAPGASLARTSNHASPGQPVKMLQMAQGLPPSLNAGPWAAVPAGNVPSIFASTAAGEVFDTPSQRTSSVFSSATSAEDILGQGHEVQEDVMAGGLDGGVSCMAPSLDAGPAVSAGAADSATRGWGEASWAAGTALLRNTSASSTASSSGGVGQSTAAGTAPPSKPRFVFNDLGGASWGVDNPLMATSTGPASLFPALQSSMSDFGNMMTKPEGVSGWQAPASSAAFDSMGSGWEGSSAGVHSGQMLHANSEGSGLHATQGNVGAGAQMLMGGPGILSGNPNLQRASYGSTASSRPLGTRQGSVKSSSQVTSPNLSDIRPAFWSAAPMYPEGTVSSMPMQMTAGLGGNITSIPSLPLHMMTTNSSGSTLQAVQLVDWQQEIVGPGGGAATPRTARACRYFMSGFCRDGERCRFSHGSPGSGLQLIQVPLSQQLSSGFNTARSSTQNMASAPNNTSGVGSFAFGAPGTDAFGMDHGGMSQLGISQMPMTSLGPNTMPLSSRGGLQVMQQGGPSHGHNTQTAMTTTSVQTTVQLRNTVTGVSTTFPAVLTVSTPVQVPMQQVSSAPSPQHPTLPDELTFSPTVSPRSPAPHHLMLR